MAKTIITLGREYCTGGRYIAEDVAKALGIKLYDKELITMAAKNSGLSEEAVAASEKRHTHSLLYSLYTMGNELPLGDQVFILQSRIIKQLAEEGPCVILGRCGDYVLRERKDVLRVFVYAPKEWRLQYAKTNPLVKAKDEKGIKDEVEKTDRNRSAYYNYYTQNRWGDAHNYGGGPPPPRFRQGKFLQSVYLLKASPLGGKALVAAALTESDIHAAASPIPSVQKEKS